MTSTKSFHLRWNNHLTNLRTLLEYLYNHQSFVDVTLSCSDGLLRAHKLVLSACSPYFDSIFRENPCKHPTVILRGISLREMQLIIEYMYVGAVDIPENELSNLLEIANELHIKGLVQDSTDEDESKTSPKAEFKETVSECEMKNSFDSSNNEENSSEGMDVTSLLDAKVSDKVISSIHNTERHSNQISNLTPTETEANVNIKEEPNFKFEYSEDRNYSPDLFCTICNRFFLSKQNMKRHMQTHSGIKPHQCDYCHLSFLRLSHLQRHHRTHTGERPFQCNQCERQFSRSDKLKQHVVQHHSGVVVPKEPKQRGRPRKVPLNVPINLVSIETQKLSAENSENMNAVTSYPTVHQIYNIASTLPGISVVQ